MKEITQIIPDEAQLWVTTHSLGVLRAAQELDISMPSAVCIIDFDAIDPDIPREIVPSNLGRVAWEKMLSIAIDDLSTRVAPRVVVICEGSSLGSRRKDFDAEIYNRNFSRESAEIVFVSGGSSNQVDKNGVSVRNALESILPKTKIIALCDRDDKSDDEVYAFEARGNLVLTRRNLESFLFDEEIINILVKKCGKIDLLEDAKLITRNAASNSVSRGNSQDDLKSAAGDIYVGLKKLLQLSRCGNNVDAFMRDTLAPLIEPGLMLYNELRSGILDRIIK